MRKITAGELARMKATTLETLNDECSLYAYVGTADSLHEIVDAWDTGTFNVACGFMETSEYRDERGEIVVLKADAVLALPLTQTLALNAKVEIRNKTYAVDGITPGYLVQIAGLVERRVSS